ncbi:MAG: protein kinase [Myxococcales bacterium]|nr:protein kinase [Myxococcales bacterium]
MSQADQNPTDPLIDTLIAGRYRVVKRLGEGGMGEVYLAMHEAIEKKVALKVLRPEYSAKADIVTRFQQEAISASRIKHPNVLEIFDFGQLDSGAFYLAMEFLEGHDLADELQRVVVLGPQDGIRIALQICRALSAAHGKGVVHRDMKPENVFLQRVADGEEIVKIVDFGIAQLRTNEEAEKQQPTRRRLTKTGMIFGTPEYMSPEQAAGKKADQRVDIYATGIILYEMFTGAVPFTGETFMAVLAAHLNDDPPPMRMIAPDLQISQELEQVIMRALAKKPEERFQSMNEMAQALLATPEGMGAGPVTRQLMASDPQLSMAAGHGYNPNQSVGAVTGHQFNTPGPQTSAQFAPGHPTPNPLGQDGNRGSMNPPTAVSPGHPPLPQGNIPPMPQPHAPNYGQPPAQAITIGSVEDPNEADRISRAHTYLEATGPTRAPEKKSKLGLVIGALVILLGAAGAAVFVIRAQAGDSPAAEPSESVAQLPSPPSAPAPQPSASAPPEPTEPKKFTLTITTEPEGAVLKKGDFQVCPKTPCDIVADPEEQLELSASKGALKGSEKVLAQKDGQSVVIKLKAPVVQRQPAAPRMCEVEVDGLKILRPCK